MPDLFGDDPDALQPAQPLLARPAALAAAPGRLHLGTSSWAFPGWQGLVWAHAYAERRLAAEGLRAYSRHPLLDAVGIDRGFYAALDARQYATYAAQVPEGFRFLVKAPERVTAATLRDARGTRANPEHLDADVAIAQFVAPATEGLGDRLGALVFQVSPLPPDWLQSPVRWIERLGEFLARLPRGPLYAVEIRDPALLRPSLMSTLREAGATYCLGLHARLPPIDRQLQALDALEAGRRGPLVVRWNLHRGMGYEQARSTYAPFDRLVDPDPDTRAALARRIAAVMADGQPALVIANNKAEGSAPRTLQALAEAVAAALREGDAATALRERA